MRRFCIASSVFFVLLFFRVVPVRAEGRTCCIDGSRPETCNACSSSIYFKNHGDACGSQANCQTCPADRPVGNGCYDGGGGGSPTAPPTATPVPRVSISSTIQYDPVLTGGDPARLIGLSDSYCDSATVTRAAYTDGSIRARNTATNVTYSGSISGGTYTITNIPQATDAYCVEFTPADPNIVCTCPAGCRYCGKDAPVAAPQSLRFFVSPVGPAWFQTVGGDIAALARSGRAVRDMIPTTCSAPGCLAYLSLPLKPEFAQSAGSLVTYKSASVDLSDAVGLQDDNVSELHSTHAQVDSGLSCTYTYDYFYRHYSLGSNPPSDFANPLDARKPATSPASGKDAYYYSGAAPLTIASPWTLGVGDSYVIFVKGNLRIQNTITVPKGAFLAFIVSGSTSVSADVGVNDKSSVGPGVVQGVYISTGTFSVQGYPTASGGNTDKKFIGEGTFSACGGIVLDRDFARNDGGIDNNLYPSSLFLYRPDFVLTLPTSLKVTTTQWMEIGQ